MVCISLASIVVVTKCCLVPVHWWL